MYDTGMRKSKHRMGRPPIDPKVRLSEVIGVRVTVAELRRLEAEARRRGCLVAELLMKPWRKGD
jgi:hypothetical protein